MSDTPSLSAWAGGEQAFTRVFADMDPHHAAHVARFVSEVLGGPPSYSEAGGSHAGMITRHLNRHLTHVQRRAWMALLLDTADELGLADDPEFRASLTGYLEWGSRLAVLNSQDGVEPPDAALPMPAWTWSSPGGPYRP